MRVWKTDEKLNLALVMAIYFHGVTKQEIQFSQKLLQPAILLKVSLLPGCFSHFFNFTNGNKSRKASQIQLL